VPTVPPGNVVVVMVMDALTCRVSALVAVRELASVTCTMKVELPSGGRCAAHSPGLLKVRPAGSVPDVIAQLNGPVPPEAVSWLL
jgi:hypothetical protein